MASQFCKLRDGMYLNWEQQVDTREHVLLVDNVAAMK